MPNATKSKIINFEKIPSISNSDFDAMTDDSALLDLIIETDDESFGNSSIPCIVLFELASGKKGAIKAKEVNSDRLLVDIKIQKY